MVAERRARRFGTKIGRRARWAGRQKNQKLQNANFGQNHVFTQQLAQESIRGENLEFFQLKPPLKLFSMGTFSGQKKYRNFSKISKIPKKKRQKIPGMGEESSKNGFGPFF